MLWIGGSVVFLAGLAICCVGLGVFSFSSALSAQARVVQRKLSTERQKSAVKAQVIASLRDLADTLNAIRAAEFEYPLELPELAPDDPWGRPILYSRVSPDRAELRSLGPDGVRGTSDDQVLTLPND